MSGIAILKTMRTMWRKVRLTKGVFHNNLTSDHCNTFIPDQLPGGDINNVCDFSYKGRFSQGMQWFCSKPNTLTKDQRKSFDCGERLIWYGDRKGHQYLAPHWSFSDILNDPYKLDRVYEKEIFRKDIIVYGEDSSIDKSLSVFKTKTNLPGFWYENQWYDRVIPNSKWSRNSLSIGEALKNTIVIRFGDSIANHVWRSQRSAAKFQNWVIFKQIFIWMRVILI